MCIFVLTQAGVWNFFDDDMIANNQAGTNNSLHADYAANLSNNLVCAAAMALSMGTNVGNDEKVVSGTCRQDSVDTLLPSLLVPQNLVSIVELSLLLFCMHTCRHSGLVKTH